MGTVMEVTRLTYNRETLTWQEEMHMVYLVIAPLGTAPLVRPDMAHPEHQATETVRLVTQSTLAVEVTPAAMSKTAPACQ